MRRRIGLSRSSFTPFSNERPPRSLVAPDCTLSSEWDPSGSVEGSRLFRKSHKARGSETMSGFLQYLAKQGVKGPAANLGFNPITSCDGRTQEGGTCCWSAPAARKAGLPVCEMRGIPSHPLAIQAARSAAQPLPSSFPSGPTSHLGRPAVAVPVPPTCRRGGPPICGGISAADRGSLTLGQGHLHAHGFMMPAHPPLARTTVTPTVQAHRPAPTVITQSIRPVIPRSTPITMSIRPTSTPITYSRRS